MASRRFNQFRYSAEQDVVELFAKITIGATGAPTLAQGKAISSVVRNSAGKYTITLADNYNMLLDCSIQQISASAPSAPLASVTSQAVNSSTAPTVVIQMANTSQVATDPDNGNTLLVRITCRNSSI